VEGEGKTGYIKRCLANRKTPLVGKALDEYVAKKRSTTGQRYTWSDGITYNAMASSTGRPIMQCTYPRYIDGECQPELPPKWTVSYMGERTQLPIYIHYNGINHYNAIVPASFNVP